MVVTFEWLEHVKRTYSPKIATNEPCAPCESNFFLFVKWPCKEKLRKHYISNFLFCSTKISLKNMEKFVFESYVTISYWLKDEL